ncbi:MAG: HD domain-containing protein [Patescibacteria group bacterium]|nr:HD domain-containing protein [Patescibacteria group bacterium]
MHKSAIIERTRGYVRSKFETEGTGHDWWHIERVLNSALAINKKERADPFIVELGALLHDIADFKFNGGDAAAGGKAAREWLEGIGADPATTDAVCHIVDNVSFKGLGEKNGMASLEGKIVQDADRLDAIGAIGVARAFAYGGYKGRPLFDPAGRTKDGSFEDYKKGSDSTIHHFYEKLLHVKDLMNTSTGKRLAARRHRFIERYLEEFDAEWNGKR